MYKTLSGFNMENREEFVAINDKVVSKPGVGDNGTAAGTGLKAVRTLSPRLPEKFDVFLSHEWSNVFCFATTARIAADSTIYDTANVFCFATTTRIVTITCYSSDIHSSKQQSRKPIKYTITK